MLRAINPGRYQDLADRGYYGEGGKDERSVITLSVDRIHLFKHFPKVNVIFFHQQQLFLQFK